ncbi:NADH dehydrogenase (ubiquinone) complex I, assembly factor 6 [Diabrotica virgifera virgifera]|uniref:NADH dehydrogenase (Ubiquinone) complex I, assembly factor 6 n=1 Tax=Diabrotica virgifera virgifera TaxID=50390 RepID=A0ABM5KJW9_DIAVI|nr:NADH dehydrogenase (ubiquinone) complex I, assembly factor 6 [Diabrotica virgifera virgifera]
MSFRRTSSSLLKLFKNESLFSTYRFSSKTTGEYCLNYVKKYDYENFVCTLLLENSTRASALAVRSFNIEIAQVVENVSQETIGLMRLKFWEETVEKCLSTNYKLVPKHPVAQELFRANSIKKLSKRYLHNLINSRKTTLNILGFKSLEDMEKYTEQSVSNVYYLILESCGVKNIDADHAASHLGKAQGIVQHLRSVPHAARLNFLAIPDDILIKNKVSQEHIRRAKNSKELHECIFEIASRAHQHLMKARSLMEKVPQEGRKVLLPAVPVFIYLERLQKVDYNVFHPSLQHRSWKLLPQLWFTNFRKKY